MTALDALTLIQARAQAYLSWTTLTPGPLPDTDAIAADVVLLCDIAEAAAALNAMLKKDAPEWFDDDDWPYADNLAAELARLETT